MAKNPRNSPFSVVELFDGIVVETLFFFDFQWLKLENQITRIMPVTKARKSSAICYQKILGLEKMRRRFCIGPYGKCAKRLLLRSAATDNSHIYTVNSIQTDKCLGQKSAQKIV